MDNIQHIGGAVSFSGTEEEWLGTPGTLLFGKWYVYYRDYPAGEITRVDMIDGELVLAEAVARVKHVLETEYTRDTLPCLDIACEPFQEVYPQVRENFPKSIVLFDGGEWYWTETLETGMLGSI